MSSQYEGGGTKTVSMFSKLVSQGSSFVMEGVKNLVVKKHVSILHVNCFIFTTGSLYRGSPLIVVIGFNFSLLKLITILISLLSSSLAVSCRL